MSVTLLGHLSPAKSSDYARDDVRADVESTAQLDASDAVGVSLANSPDIVFGQFVIGMIRTATVSFRMTSRRVFITVKGTSFLHHVSRIIQSGAKKQVFRITAQPLIAMMQHHLAIWNGFVRQFVCETVRATRLVANRELSIGRDDGSAPNPAAISLIDILPEALLRIGLSPVGKSACFRAITSRSFMPWSPTSLTCATHLASICRSMMRRTSSAMEMPRRFASRIRNFLCGSVKEIICLVIAMNLVSFLEQRNEFFFRSCFGGVAAKALFNCCGTAPRSQETCFVSGTLNTFGQPMQFMSCLEQLNHQLVGRVCGVSCLDSKSKRSRYNGRIGHVFSLHPQSIPQGIPCQ